jgi:cell division protein FtsQ
LTESAKQAGADAPSQALASLRLTEHGLWQAELASDAKVELGSGDAAQVLVRANRWLAALPSAADKLNVKASAALGSLQSADLRYGQGFAVRWAGITTR